MGWSGSLGDLKANPNPTGVLFCSQRSKSNAGRIPLFASTYQSDFSQPQVDRLDITKDRYGMPRDFLVAYREACHTSVGKASLFVKSSSEAAEGLKQFSMMLQPGEYRF